MKKNVASEHGTMDVAGYAKFQIRKTRDELLECLLRGKTCVLLGFPGSGKTCMTSDLIRCLRCEHSLNVAVTGSTGSAAQQVKTLISDVQGVKTQTVHSFLGIRQEEMKHIDKRNTDLFEQAITRRRNRRGTASDAHLSCDILVVEEVSMLTSEFIQAMDTTLRIERQTDRRFGGVTVLFVGDFRQLPPVSKGTYAYSFLHPKWKDGTWIDKVFSLEFIMRQSTDAILTDMIMRLSHNATTEDDLDRLQERVVPNGIYRIMDVDFLPDALRVFCSNEDVKLFHRAMARRAVKERTSSISLDVKWKIPKNVLENRAEVIKRQLKKDMVFSEELFVGSHVLITANLCVDDGVVNGTTGKVVGWERGTKCSYGDHTSLGISVLLDSGQTVTLGYHTIFVRVGKFAYIEGSYVPLLLCHAMTVHRLQGSTVRRPLFYRPKQIGKFFPEFYVIASRVTSIDLLHLTHLPTNMGVIIDPLVQDYYNMLFREKK